MDNSSDIIDIVQLHFRAKMILIGKFIEWLIIIIVCMIIYHLQSRYAGNFLRIFHDIYR